MPDIKALEVYYWTATLRSFSAAANKCRMTQSAVSQRTAALETEFGTPLLMRNNKSVELTTKGIELLTFADRFLQLQREMNSIMNDKSERVETLRLGCIESIAYTWLNDFIGLINTSYPFVSVDVTIGDTWKVRSDLQNTKIDLALMLGPNPHRDLTETTVGQMHLAWISSPKLNISGARCAIEDIARQMVITYPRGTLPYEFIKALLTQQRAVKPRICGNGSLTAIVKMIRNGSGIGLIPMEAVSRELESGELRVLETGIAPPHLNFVASYNNNTAGEMVLAALKMAQCASEDWLAN